MESTDLVVNNDAAILDRLIDHDGERLSVEAARYVLGLEFCQADRDRMRALAEKAGAGNLTAAGQGESLSYERVGHLVALLKSKARRCFSTRVNARVASRVESTAT